MGRIINKALLIRLLLAGGFLVHYLNCTGQNLTGLYYRTASSGKWHDLSTWQSSWSPEGPWLFPGSPPNYSTEAIHILAGHWVSVESLLTADQLLLEGILEIKPGDYFTISNGPGDDMIIGSGGVFLFNGGNVPNFQNSDVKIRIMKQGVVRVSVNVSGLSSKLAGNESQTYFIYEDGAIFHWDTSSLFSSSGQTYFPGVSENCIPLFLLTGNINSAGGAGETIINGHFKATGNIVWKNKGIKTFRNGISGSGKVTQDELCGKFIVSGKSAVLGGSGSLVLNDGLLISSEYSNLEGDLYVSKGLVEITGCLDAGANIITTGGDLNVLPGGQIMSDNATIIFCGDHAQNFWLNGTLKVKNVSVNNPYGLSIKGKLTISDILEMSSGNIHMLNDTLEIGHSNSEPGNISYVSGTITGMVRKWISGNELMFPVGSRNTNNPAKVIFNVTPPPGSISAQFITQLPENYYGNLPFMQDDIIFNTLSDHGLWQLDAHDINSPISFTIELDASGFPGINNPYNIRILSRESGTWEWQLQGDFMDYQGNNIFSHSAMSRLGQFALAGHHDENPLPVELVSLQALRLANIVIISWTTASEINNEYFAIERSPDTREFEEVGRLQGAGTSSHYNYYQYQDYSSSQGVVYYRIKQTDFDGRYKYSKWVLVEENLTASIKVIFSIQDNHLKVFSHGNQPLLIDIYDLSGKKIFSRVLPSRYNIIPLDGYGQHIILYRVYSNTEIISGKAVLTR